MILKVEFYGDDPILTTANIEVNLDGTETKQEKASAIEQAISEQYTNDYNSYFVVGEA